MAGRAGNSMDTVSTRLVARVLSLAVERGHDPDALCRGAGVDPTVLRDPDGRVSYALAEHLADYAAHALRDPCLGLHLAQHVSDPTTYDAGALLLMASATLRQGLDRAIRYQRYWGGGERLRLAARPPDGALLRYALPGPSGSRSRHTDECALAELVIGMRFLSGHDVVPRAVRFRHRAPPDTREHAALFRCPMEFGAPHTELEIDDAVLDLPLTHANAAYAAIFERQVEAALARLPAEVGAAEGVRVVARAALSSGECTLARTARAMGVSVRTLQRRLKDDGTSFEEVLDAVRREVAVESLARRMTIVEVAFLLGYADASAFHRAFKRWTGMSPEEARRLALEGPPRGADAAG